MMETKFINSEENRKKEKEFNNVNLFKNSYSRKIEQELNNVRMIINVGVKQDILY